MKRAYFTIALIMLAGCSHLRQYDASIAKQQEAVAQAQAEVDAAMPKCTGGKRLKDLPPPAYLKGVKCYTKLVEDKMVPVSPYPQPLKKFLYTNLENASLYAQGKISYEQLEARGKLAALAMDNETNQIRNDIRQQYADQDAAARASLANSLGSFQPPRPTYTTCSNYGSTIQCRSQ